MTLVAADHTHPPTDRKSNPVIGGDCNAPAGTSNTPANDQRKEALKVALERRAKRASLREDIATGELGFDELLDDPPEVMVGYQVIRLLTWIPYVGQTKAKKLFERALPDRSKLVTLGCLTREERRALYGVVEGLC